MYVLIFFFYNVLGNLQFSIFVCFDIFLFFVLQVVLSEVMVLRVSRMYDFVFRLIILVNGILLIMDNMVVIGQIKEYIELVFKFCYDMVDFNSDNVEYVFFTVISIFLGIESY